MRPSSIRRAIRAVAVVSFIAGSLTLMLGGSADAAPAAVGLGTAGKFGVLAGQGVTNTGPSSIAADLGSCPNPSITGFPPGTVGGTIHANDAVACQAQKDLITAYNDAAGRPATKTYGGPTDLGGSLLVSGVYKSPSSFAITGTLTLDGQNDPGSVWIFQAGTTLITATNSSVNLVNGAQACNVFWQVGSSATLGVGSSLMGTVMALSAISAKTNAVVAGRLLARNAAVTLDTNQIRRPPCSTAPPTTTSSSTTSTTRAGGVTTTTQAGGVTTTTRAGGVTTTTRRPGGVTTTTRPRVTTTTRRPGGATTTTRPRVTTSTTRLGGGIIATPPAGGLHLDGGAPAPKPAPRPAPRIIRQSTGAAVRGPGLAKTGAPRPAQPIVGSLLLAAGLLLTYVSRPPKRLAAVRTTR